MVSATTDRRLGLAGNTAYKVPATVVATANITQSGEQTIDGIAVLAINAAGVPDRVLCVGMTDTTKNGLWDVKTSAWTRSIDSNGNYDLTQGTQVLITRGTYAFQIWVLTTLDPITIGTTALAWSQSVSAASIATLGSSSGAGFIGWIQFGLNAVLRTVLDRLRDTVSVFDFMTTAQIVDVRTGLAALDVSAAIQAAHDSLGSNGGSLYFPAGTYRVSTSITISKPIRCVGSDYGSIIKTVSGTNDVFVVTVASLVQGTSFANLNFTTGVIRTAGSYIQLTGAYYVQIDRCWMTTGFNGISCSGGAFTGLRVKDCIITDTVNYGIYIGTNGNNADVLLKDVFLHGVSSVSQSVAGVRIESGGDITIDHVSTVYSGNGLDLKPPNGKNIQALFVSNSFFDSGSGWGVFCRPDAGGTIQLQKYANVWACTNTSGGFGLAGAGNIQMTELTACTGSNNAAGHGILINSATATNTTIVGGSYSANTNGIFANTGANQFRIIGARCGPAGQFAGNSSVGIILAGTNDNYVIQGCDVRGNTTVGLSNAGGLASPTTQVIRDNVGYVSENNSTATVLNATSSLAVNHGLGETPTSVIVCWAGAPDAALLYAAPADFTSTQFTIRTSANVSANRSVAWRAVRGAQ